MLLATQINKPISKRLYGEAVELSSRGAADVTVKVNYSNFKAAAERDSAELDRLMCRDASWGTHVEVLEAAKRT